MKTIGLPKLNKLIYLLFFICVFSASSAQNGLCEMAIEIDCGFRDGNNDTGMFNADEYCGTSSNLTGPEIVFVLVPPVTQVYTFDLDVFGAGQDLDMFLLDSDCDPDDCIENSDGTNANSPDIITTTLIQGELYYLVLDGDGGSISEFLLEVSCSPTFQCDFDDIECDDTITSNNDTGSQSIDAYCNGNNTNLTGPERVFRFVAPLSQTYTFLMTGFSGDLDMFLVEDSCDPDDCIANSDAQTSTSFDLITVSLDAGETYFLIVDGDGGTISDFELTIECGASCEADFSYVDDCGKVTFTNDSSGDNLSYEWLIDGLTYNDANPCVQFTSSGTYIVILTVTSPNCEDTIEKEIIVELCPQELYCDCCPDGAQYNFEDEIVGPVSTFFQATWQIEYGAPSYIAEGCDNPNSPISLEIAGPNIVTPGSAVSFGSYGINGDILVFEKDSTYCISYCYRVKAETTNGQLKMRATNNPLTNGVCSGSCTVINISPAIGVQDGWQTHQFLWTADDDYFEYVFSTDDVGPTDEEVNINIDNVCVSPYSKTCKASFTYVEDECGNIDFTSTSCGDDITESWVINGSNLNGPFVSLSGPGVFNVTLNIVGVDGCTDTVSQTITTTGPTPLELMCPFSESVLSTEVNGECFYSYTVPVISTNNNSSINCFYNGLPISAGDILLLPFGSNTFNCTATGECDQIAECAWNIFVECESENTCPSDGSCDLISTVNLSTGIDASGNVIPSGTGQMDPFWKVINNAPVPASCTNSQLGSLNGTPYVINFVWPNIIDWINIPGAGVIAPYNIGNNGQFGCNNLQNNNGDILPYIFQRSFCVCEEDKFILDVNYEGDDQLILELFDLTNNSVVATGLQYTYPAAPVNFNYCGVLTPGSYAIRAYLANTGSTVLGFAMNGSIISSTGQNSIVNYGECCSPQTIHVQKILDFDCSSDISNGDQVGVGWNFNLKNSSGGIIQSGTTDINGEIFFNNVLPDNYILEEVINPGWTSISPIGGVQNINVTSSSFNSFTFFNCPSPEVDCDSLMIMSKRYDLPCFDASVIHGLPCLAVDDPVCGCDGQTYSNACYANEAGITIYVPGECNSNNIPSTDDLCCYSLDIKNNLGPDITKLEIELLSPDWIFNYVLLDPSLKFGNSPVLNNQFCVVSSTGNGLPIGQTLDAIKTCFAPTTSSASSPQVVEFRWIQSFPNSDSLVVCRDTLIFECDSDPRFCFEIEEDQISCNNPDDPSHYEYCFTIKNYSGFDIGKITVEDLPSGFSFLDNCTASKTILAIPNPITVGSTSQQMCVQIKSSIPIVSPQDICFKMGVISTDNDECCHSPEEICKEILPCCDPCEDNFVKAIPLDTLEDCCYSIDIGALCQKGYFTRLEAQILTPGVCFGSHVMGSFYAGFWNVTSSASSISMSPIAGNIDQPYYQDLFRFCLDKIDSSAQNNPEIKFNWYAIDPMTGEEIIACMDTIKTGCEAPKNNLCASITDQKLECVPDSSKYRYTFTITNNSNPAFTADKLHLTVENDPFNYEAFPTGPIIPLSPPLDSGQTRTISTCIKGTPFQPSYSDFVFSYRLQNMATGDCCFESVLDTIEIPPCDTMSCCDINEEEFCAYFDDLLDYEINDCKITWNLSDLDSCDVVTFNFADGISISPDVNNTVCKVYSESTAEEVCVTIERWDNTQNLLLPCLTKDTCFTIEVICDPPPVMCPSCPFGTVVNDLVTNGNFEMNTNGFTSDYAIGPPSLTAGQFDVRGITLGNTSWAAVDHTTGYIPGKFLVADGPFNGAIWRQTVNVTPGQTYNFCAWFNNLVIPSLVDNGTPLIEVWVNGLLIGTPLSLPQIPDQWINYSDSWIASLGTTSATIEIFNVSPTGFGDVALDDVSFVECVPEVCCEDEDAFCDLVDLGWQITIDDCEVKVQADQFGACHWMYNVSPDFGDGSILLPTVSPANGCWSHKYSAPGVYNICATIFEGDSLGNECWSKTICQEIEVDCDCTKDSACIEISNIETKEIICDVTDCYANPFCEPWLTNLMIQSNTNGCQAIVDYNRFDKAIWNGQSVIIGYVSGAPDGGGEDIYLCDGTLIQSCRAAIGIICNPDAGINISSDLSNVINIWNCGDQLQQFGADCFATNTCVNYCVTVTNKSDPAIPVTSLELNQVTTGNISVLPNPYLLSPPLLPNQSRPINFQVCGDFDFGDVIKIDIGLPMSMNTLCCANKDTVDLIIPECMTCDTMLDPCSLVSTTLVPDPINTEVCCLLGTIDNQYCDNYFKGIKVNVNLPATISQIQTLNGWTISQLNPSQVELYPPTNYIAQGQQDIFRLCNANDGSLFTVDVSWLVLDSLGNCEEVCLESFDELCPIIPDGCVEIVQDSIDCNNNVYCFKVVNKTIPEIVIKSVEFIQVSPNGASLTPNPYSINPLSSGDTSEWICVDYDAFGNNDMCFLLVGHEADLPAGDSITWCCVDSLKYFIEIEEPCPCRPTSTACENVSVDLVSDPTNTDLCCFEGTIDNEYCSEYFKGIKVEVNLPATISQIQTLNGWTISQLNPSQVELYPPTNFIALGQQDIFRLCNANDGSLITVDISWLVLDSLGNCEEVCMESFDEQCPIIPGGCVEIVQDSIDCDNDIYCFKVVNKTMPEIVIKSVEFIQLSPNGASLSPNPYSINPLSSSDTSEWICVDYDAFGNDDLCFLLVGHEADLPAGDSITWCCVDSLKYFIEIEERCPCGPTSTACENVSVDLVSDPTNTDLCCFEGTIDNDYCADYFKGIKISTSNTSNISQVQSLNGWSIHQLNSSEAELYPPINYIPLGSTKIFSVCNNANLNPFDIKVSWLVADNSGNCIEVCDSVFDLTCTDTIDTGCITITQDSIDCDNGIYCFKIQNNSNPGFTIKSIDLISIMPIGTNLTPNPISIPDLFPGMTSDWICVNYTGVASGEELCFYAVAHNEDINQGNVPTQCCVTNESLCVEIDCSPPPGLECVQILEDSLNCEKGEYCFKIRNNTNPGFDIKSINLINVSPSNSGFNNTPVAIPTLSQGSVSDWICVEYFGTPEDMLCFNTVVHLQDITNGEEPTWCCSTLTPHCFVIEDCNTCCEDQSVFSDLVMAGVDTSVVNCELNFTFDQFNDCHWIDANGIDWGDGSFGPDSLMQANGNWNHTFATDDTYNVCVTIFEGQDENSKCWEETICFDVEAICIIIEEPCDNTTLLISNGLTPNNDGLNDRLIIQQPEICGAIQLRIYNRWGQEVYASKDYKNDWTGLSLLDEALPSGTYFLVAGYLDSDDLQVKSFIDLRR